MKPILSFFFIFILVNNLVAQEYQSIDSILLKAKSENKKVLLYFSGSDWCAPCIRFKKNYIDQLKFQDFAQSNLVIYNADFPRKKANQLGKEATLFNEKLADAYNASGNFPMIVLLHFDGEIIKKWESLPSESLDEFINAMR